jgi:hypothetical protein
VRRDRRNPGLRDRALTGVAEKYRTAIDQAQPYRRGDAARWEPLSILSWLSNVDKHRFIHPVWAVIGEVTRERF